MTESNKISRRDAILQTLARMLEEAPEQKITTASLAREVGVTEAALYRHFPSKKKMYEGLLAFAEDIIFPRCQQILQAHKDPRARLQQLTTLVLTFLEKNPGIARILHGVALYGEAPDLQARATGFFDRLETEVRQILKTGDLELGIRPQQSYSIAASWLMVQIEGRLQRFVRSGYAIRPAVDWEIQWRVVQISLFEGSSNAIP